jgi:ketosteroid isomerase-like protein
VITREFAQRFAAEWIAAWNAHDLERILAHYSEDFEMASPVIAQLMNEASGTLRGKAAIGEYWATALARVPDLHFELVDVFVGAHSAALTYRGHRGLSTEVF